MLDSVTPQAMPIALKARAQKVLKRLGLYHRVKASRLYDIYWMIADKRVISDRAAEVRFYRRYLEGFQPGDLFFDIGANEGYKTRIFLTMGARVIAVDPDEHNQHVLRQSFSTLRLAKRRVEIVGKAVSDDDAGATFWIEEPGSAKNTLNSKWVGTLRTDEQRFGARLSFSFQRRVDTVSLQSPIAKYGVPFFIKIDVEGHEPGVLRGLHQPVPYLSFEVNLPEFRQEGEECIEMLLASIRGDDSTPRPIVGAGCFSRNGSATRNSLRHSRSARSPRSRCSGAHAPPLAVQGPTEAHGPTLPTPSVRSDRRCVTTRTLMPT